MGPDSLNTKNTAIVTINSVELRPIEVDSQRVVTLAMIDKVHGRPDGTARRNFNTNKERLVEGEDFIVRNSSDAAALGFRAANGITFLTESGYLMLVKSFNDDLAWTVQKQLVRSYFKLEKGQISVARRVPHTDLSRECRLSMNLHLKMAKMAGLEGNQALLAANKATASLTGIDSLGLMGITHMKAPQNEALLTPTDIGKRLGGVSAKHINLVLTGMGLQIAPRDHKGHIQYEPTEAGIEAGGVMQDTGKKHSTGTPVRQLRWASSIVHVVEDAMQQEHAA